jgi:predicted transcriptional regulator
MTYANLLLQIDTNTDLQTEKIAEKLDGIAKEAESPRSFIIQKALEC